jgi:AmmeMemoRadiSam system protein B/AmmeMemoRadiSam system protein A
MERVREPAVAGSFYPDDPAVLKKQVEGFMAHAQPQGLHGLRALVSPHAGYRYSGPVAASGFRQVVGSKFERVVILSPSHRVAFRGVAIPDADSFRTPLGKVAVSPAVKDLAGHLPFVVDSRPHAEEHALEVQLPFLQLALERFELVPLVFGDTDPEAVARQLAPLADEKTLFVASSDLSHYYPYETARALDSSTVQSIVEMNIDSMKDREACGKGPILTLMHLARARGWKPVLLDHRNSGDTSGDHSRVVGYASIAWTGTRQPTELRDTLLKLARASLEHAAREHKQLAPPADPSPALREKKGCFVTLTVKGELRGCIGNIFPELPLGEAVTTNAYRAALSDPRFSPVTPSELASIEVEVSVLGVPQPLDFTSPEDLLRKLRPHHDGVVFSHGLHRATFLPQVWEKLPLPTEFLSHLSVKAGLSPEAWREPAARIQIYEVQAFSESNLESSHPR